MAKSEIFYYSCLLFLIGILFGSFFAVPRSVLGLLLILCLVFLAAGFWLKKQVLVFLILCLAFILGVWRCEMAAEKIFQSKLAKLNNGGRTLTLEVIVDEDPDIKLASQQIRARVVSPAFYNERITATFPKYPFYHYGDKLRLIGSLKEPENFGTFNYQGYLAKEGIYSAMIFPQAELLASGQGNWLKQVLIDFKDKFRQAWQKLLSPPHLGIFEALVFGEEQNIPAFWKEKLNFAGVRHLTAVSGMNITIISYLLLGLFLGLGLWRRQAFLFSLGFIWLYILMIGAPSSALRAGVMISFLFLAQLFGRLVIGFRILIFSAVILLLANPLLLRFDVGFQLSFLAMVGLIFWQPFFEEKVFKTVPKLMRTGLSATFAAQVFTLPILIYNFGYVSLVSPLTNVLLEPAVPYLTLFGFVFGILGMLFLPLGQVLAWVLWPGMAYLLVLVDLSLKIPFSHVVFHSSQILFLIVGYPLLILLTWQQQKQQQGPTFLN
jgi:competence protein ComEC